MTQFYKLKIQSIIKETALAVSLLFEVPANLKEVFSFQPGQYVTLKAIINGEEVRRAYSICSSPNSGELKVAIKAVEDGTFSVFATSKLQEGDEIEVHPPEGKFIIDVAANKNYIAFAAGSGITPVLSMIKSVLENEISSTFTLIYGNKSVAETIFYNELNELKEQYNNQFNLHYIYSRENIDSKLFGRIGEEITNYFIKKTYKDTAFDAAYLCGPEAMINVVSETLQANNFNKENILFELFTASTSEENTAQIKDGETLVSVLLDDEDFEFTMKQTDTLLAASLRNKIDAPYSCQGGVCSSCLARITEGKAVMTKNSILTDGEVADGYVLTCQAHPTTSKVVVDFDDV